MDEYIAERNGDALSEWSKWAIGLSLFSATGCVGVLLEGNVKEANLPNIKAAIVCFLIAVVIAWGVQLFTALLKGDYFESANRTRQQILRTILWFLVIAEVISFVLSVTYLSKWVLNLKSKEKPATESVKNLSTTNLPVKGLDTVSVVKGHQKEKDTAETKNNVPVLPHKKRAATHAGGATRPQNPAGGY